MLRHPIDLFISKWDAHVKLTVPDIEPLDHVLALLKDGVENKVLFKVIVIWLFVGQTYHNILNSDPFPQLNHSIGEKELCDVQV